MTCAGRRCDEAAVYPAAPVRPAVSPAQAKSFRTCRLLPAQLGNRASLMRAGHLVCQQVESEFSIIDAFGKASP